MNGIDKEERRGTANPPHLRIVSGSGTGFVLNN